MKLKLGIAGGVLAIGVAAFVWLMVTMLQIANQQQSAGFTANAEALRRDVVIEGAIVVLAALLIAVLARTWIRRTVLASVVLWIVVVATTVILAQVTVIP